MRPTRLTRPSAWQQATCTATLTRTTRSHQGALPVAAFFATNTDVDVLTVHADEFCGWLREHTEVPATSVTYDTCSLAFDWEYRNRLPMAGTKFARAERVLSSYYFSDSKLTSRASLQTVKECTA
jgi:hypothetical protein